MKLHTFIAWSGWAYLASTQELAAFLSSRDDLSSFRAALHSVPDLLDTLSSASNITILAPTNAAFEPTAMNETTDIRERLESDDEDRLSELLQYHVLNGTWSNDTLYNWNGPVHTLLIGNGLVTGGQIVLPGRRFDRVSFSSGSPATSGQRSSQVLETNITDSIEGITIHTIDAILHVPLSVSDFYGQWSENSRRSWNATDDGNVTGWALIPDLDAAGLLDEVESTPDVTLFTGHIPPSTRFSGEDLEAVLRYHIVTGRVLPYSQDMLLPYHGGPNYNVSTLEGGEVYVNRRPHSWNDAYEAVWVNDNEVLGGDWIIANGVMNVLDRRTTEILTPPGVEEVESAAPARCIPSSALAAFLAVLAFALS